MSFDLARFHAAFFAESREQLDAMEAELVRWSPEAQSREAIDTIFRAAHSVKGGSATFGFADVASLTHLLETLLHEVRSGQRSLEGELVDGLLRSVDCLRNLLAGHEHGTAVDQAALTGLTAHFQALVGQAAGPLELERPPAAARRRWVIDFRPRLPLFQRGNDPYRLLRELAELGEMTVTADLSRLPVLADLDPESCFLHWKLHLDGDATREQIEEIFEWVAQDCELEIEAERLDAPRALAPTRRDDAGLGSGSIRVDVEKVDQLVNRVGELVVTESRLRQLLTAADENEFSPLRQALEALSGNIRDLQENALQMRMVPLAFAFHRLPRLVRDLCADLAKDAALEIHGEQTELDKGLLEAVTDPLVHLVRNAVDHGIEDPATRVASGKTARARIAVRSYYRSGVVVIEVEDDGRGLDADMIRRHARERGLLAEGEVMADREAMNLIFSPGFSTAVEVTDVSGRGVGLDVVRRNIQRMGGRVTIDSEVGRGTRISIEVPLTLSIIDGQLARIGDSLFVIPVLSVVESIRPQEAHFEQVAGGKRVYRFRGGVVPLVDLDAIWRLGRAAGQAPGMVVVVEWGQRLFGLLVDELLDHQSVVIKSLEENFRRVSGLAGATVLGDGSVALVLDIGSLDGLVGDRRRHRRGTHDVTEAH